MDMKMPSVQAERATTHPVLCDEQEAPCIRGDAPRVKLIDLPEGHPLRQADARHAMRAAPEAVVRDRAHP